MMMRSDGKINNKAMFENLKKYRILLASKSPRRKELLSELGFDFEIATVENVDETYPNTLPVLEIAQYISNKKANSYSKLLKNNELIITADTLVVCDNEVLGKPKNTNDAVEMLMKLSEKTHLVVTGVTILTKDKNCSFSVQTEVEFSKIDKSEAEYYVAKYSPMDKAGAYGIQEWIGCIAVKSIKGSFYNVMGLPVHRLYQELKAF